VIVTTIDKHHRRMDGRTDGRIAVSIPRSA